jgi:hypothetical protein
VTKREARRYSFNDFYELENAQFNDFCVLGPKKIVF